jgi:hypothetical protein
MTGEEPAATRDDARPDRGGRLHYGLTPTLALAPTGMGAAARALRIAVPARERARALERR